MKLIINADDFGYTDGISEGIIYAYIHGIVTSTTVLMNSVNIEKQFEKLKDAEGLGVGVHLNLTTGNSLTNGKSISNNEGYFFNRKEIDFTKFDIIEVYNEWKAQIEKYIEITGKLPTHLDSHHGVHYREEFIDITKKLMQEYGLKARALSEYNFVNGFYDKTANISNLSNLIIENKDYKTEIMVHCGFPDLKLKEKSSYYSMRLTELNVLCSEEIKELIKKNNIELVKY